jgi:hypothetical protein
MQIDEGGDNYRVLEQGGLLNEMNDRSFKVLQQQNNDNIGISRNQSPILFKTREKSQ